MRAISPRSRRSSRYRTKRSDATRRSGKDPSKIISRSYPLASHKRRSREKQGFKDSGPRRGQEKKSRRRTSRKTSRTKSSISPRSRRNKKTSATRHRRATAARRTSPIYLHSNVISVYTPQSSNSRKKSISYIRRLPVMSRHATSPVRRSISQRDTQK